MCCHTALCLRLIIFHKSGVYFILVLRHMKWQAPLIFFSFDSVARFKIVALHYFKKVLSNFHFNPKFFLSAEIFFCQELFLSNFSFQTEIRRSEKHTMGTMTSLRRRSHGAASFRRKPFRRPTFHLRYVSPAQTFTQSLGPRFFSFCVGRPNACRPNGFRRNDV
jgi:hypothetical protein